MIIGCDYEPGFQQIAFVDTETGELQERRLQQNESTWLRPAFSWKAITLKFPWSWVDECNRDVMTWVEKPGG
jgi:hypothetical protein